MTVSLYRSMDMRFGIALPSTVLGAMTVECARRLDVETGGILAGRYDVELRLAKIALATAPPPDSKGGHAWFRRGTAGLKTLITQLWQAGEYYLGEWHFHPGAAPAPSGQDADQMRAIAGDPRYACPEPVLVICGGHANTPLISAHVWAKGSLVPLFPVDL
jgi:proteasome lid subunit RPN8/RPN11